MKKSYTFSIFSFLFVLVFFVTGCRKQVVKSADSSSTKPIKNMNIGERIAPNTCIIVGTVVKIDTTLETTGKNNPCSKQPCVALIKIDSVLGYGAGFPPLTMGKNISLKFGFTLGPTSKELFPQMKNFYPGLKNGDTFKSVISNMLSGYSKDAKAHFIIYGYQKR